MAQIVIFGAGDIARLAHYYFTHDSEHEPIAFTVDRKFRTDDQLLDLPVVEFEELVQHFPPHECKLFVALSYAKMNRVRAQKYWAAKELGYDLVSYVSSKCTFLTDHPVGENCFILEDNTIQPFVRIGNNVTLWSGNHIGHDSSIGDHCFITSHVVVSGNCHIAGYCFIGVNATLHNSIFLAPSTLIGAGGIVSTDTLEKGVYVPERAKLINRSSDQIDL